MEDILPDVEVTWNDESILQNTTDDDFTLEEKTKDVVFSDNIGLSLNDFKDTMEKTYKEDQKCNVKNTEMIREDIQINSKAEKKVPEKSSKKFQIQMHCMNLIRNWIRMT